MVIVLHEQKTGHDVPVVWAYHANNWLEEVPNCTLPLASECEMLGNVSSWQAPGAAGIQSVCGSCSMVP